MAEGAKWHYTADRQKYGPVSAGELRRLARAGKVAADTLVWKEGMTEWRPARKVKGLLAADPSAEAPSRPAPGGDAGDAAPSSAIPSVLTDGAATAGRVIGQVGRFGAHLHSISSTMFDSVAGQDDHPAIFVRSKYFGGCIQKGLPPSTLNSLGSTVLTVLFSWLYLGLILLLTGAAWQFLPLRRTEFLSVRLRRRVRPSVIVPAVITWAVQLFPVYVLLSVGVAVMAGVAVKLDLGGIAAIAGLASIVLSFAWYGICNYTALNLLRKLNPDVLFDFQAILEYGYPRKVALIRGTSGAPIEQQLEGVLALCEQLSSVEFGRWDQVTTHGRDGIVGGIWNRVQNLGM